MALAALLPGLCSIRFPLAQGTGESREIWHDREGSGSQEMESGWQRARVTKGETRPVVERDELGASQD